MTAFEVLDRRQRHSRPLTPVEARIRHDVFEGDYPDPTATNSYTSMSELDEIATWLGLQAGDALLDAGCGRGGPGRYIAARSHCWLLGIDISQTAIAFARRVSRQDRMTSFAVDSFQHINAADASIDGAMCIDALFFASDKSAALQELGRVVRVGGRVAITDWDYTEQPIRRPRQVCDHRPLLRAAGFRVLHYEETVDWKVRLRRTLDGALAHLYDLAAETGQDPLDLRVELHETASTLRHTRRRFLCIAERAADG